MGLSFGGGKFIDNLTIEEIKRKSFFSDPHLVYKNDRLEIFYRISHQENEKYHTSLLRKTTDDGVHFTNREVLLNFSDSSCISTIGDMVRSHAVIWQNDKYMMWYVDNSNPQGIKHVRYSESSDGYNWSEAYICKLDKDINPWHIDVAFIDGEYILTIYDLYGLSLWRSSDSINFKFMKELLSPSCTYGSFYSDGLYRTSMIKDDIDLKLYFSAYDQERTYIGLMEGESLDDLEVTSIRGNNISLYKFPKSFVYIWKVRIWNIKERMKKLCLQSKVSIN